MHSISFDIRKFLISRVGIRFFSIILTILLSLVVAGTLTEFCVGSKTHRRSEFINAFISRNSDSDLYSGIVTNGTTNNGISNMSSSTPNGGINKPGGHINGGFEMRDVGHSASRHDPRHRVSGSASHGLKILGSDEDPVHRRSSSTVNADGEASHQSEVKSKLPNGDYTDDLPSFYPFRKSVTGRNWLAGPYSRLEERDDPMRRHEKPQDETAHLSKWQRLLLAFSLPHNAGKILSVKAVPGSIGCLHGIRVLSMGWVILGHVIIFGAATNFKNRADIYSQIETLLFQVIINAPLSVDTFFFMSGLLTAYLFLKECGKTEKVTLKQGIMYYVHRYWRLTPPLLIWMMIVATLVQYVGEGRPGWSDYASAQPCRDSWWVNMLYIQNLYIEKSGCMGETWYLANDMQFYMLAPLVMIPWVYKQRILGHIMAALLLSIHLASNAWLVYEYNFDILRNNEGGDYSNKLYFRPWARVGPFAIGLVVGYILYKTKCKVHLNKYVVALGWILAIGIMFTVTLITYDENKDLTSDPSGWPVAGKTVYEMLSRPMWAVMLGWIVIACATGYGGFINSILSWEGFLPLSRLTYCAYLIHLTIIGYEFIGAESTYLYTVTNLIYRFFGFYVMSYAVAFLLAVGVEAPMLGLEKVLLSR
ncbi:nose resistant to fluoxetine protein 6-like [Plakobranchus ocellatus]|uniref:Nose resistant to fluoxetine protein 6-like n=1 Tax=Plakobranchus ocellatus TaxID=259542 RepID=A0AAV4CG23_9GAST|nr:nose resistant to fluoxetine protein 6-like [Plakobranchus ocellatus]